MPSRNFRWKGTFGPAVVPVVGPKPVLQNELINTKKQHAYAHACRRGTAKHTPDEKKTGMYTNMQGQRALHPSPGQGSVRHIGPEGQGVAQVRSWQCQNDIYGNNFGRAPGKKQRNKTEKKSRRASEVGREAEVQEVAAAVGQRAGLLLAGERGEVGAEHALAALQLGLPHGR